VVVELGENARVALGRVLTVVSTRPVLLNELKQKAVTQSQISCELTCRKERHVGQEQVLACQTDYVLQI
jgi:hypothetical protein